jgi:molybdopterin-containing oxidoreductase family iron-sulfur binding subunit
LGLKEQLPWDSVKDLLIAEAKELHSKGYGSVQSSSFNGFWNGILQRGGWWDTNSKAKNNKAKPPLAANSVSLPSFDGPTGPNTFHLIPFVSLSISDGRLANLPWLQGTPDPISTAVWQTWIEINNHVAAKMGVKEGDVIQVESSQGSIRALAYPHPAVSPDVVGIPIGQGHTNFGQYASNRGSNIMSILAPNVDQDTGALAWASTRVSIKKTGEWIRLPKYEGSVPAIQTEDRKIIEITNHN